MKLTHMFVGGNLTTPSPYGISELALSSTKMKSHCTNCLMWIAVSWGNTQAVFNVCVTFQQAF